MTLRECDMPISDRIKQLCGPELTDAQKASVSTLGNTTADQEPIPLFSRAFDKADKLIPRIEAFEAKLEGATFKPQRLRYTPTH